MSNKDFLDQFSGKKSDSKPDSFKEEVRIPVKKEKKPLNKGLITGLLLLILVGGITTYFLFFAPKIEVVNFVGQNRNDAVSWIRQQEIETVGIIFKEEYSLEYGKDVIIEQYPESGKVGKNVKMTFTVSKGADPDEEISFPDIMSMTKEEIESWIKNNKLSSTKINTSFDEKVPAGEVIKYDLSGTDEDNFKRGSNLKISVSKGPAPAGTITLEDFTNRSYDSVEAWAKSKKINLYKVESFSNTVALGNVIGQSVESGKTMKEGETLTVTVSLGKGIKVPDFTSMSKNDVISWMEENSGFYKTKQTYSSTESYVVKQSIAAGRYISSENSITLTINLGTGFYLQDEGAPLSGSYDKLVDWVKEEKDRGISVSINKITVEDDSVPSGTISSIRIHSNGKEYSEIEKLPLSVSLDVTVTKKPGVPEPVPPVDPVKVEVKDFTGLSFDEIREWAHENSLKVDAVYLKSSMMANTVLKQDITEGEVTEGSTIKVQIASSASTVINLSKENGYTLDTTYDEFESWVNELNDNKLYEITFEKKFDTNSYKEYGKISYIQIGDDDNPRYSIENIPLDAHIVIYVSSK